MRYACKIERGVNGVVGSIQMAGLVAPSDKIMLIRCSVLEGI